MTGEQRQGQWTTALHSVYVVGSGPALFLPTAPHCTFAAQGAKGPLFFGESSHWLLEPHLPWLGEGCIIPRWISNLDVYFS